ncbi:hypothetical protein [Endozoicomonas sp. 8E]|uniref:hypothetical protein n=1 Tax=Endozoicomonas sp. 8E TaxID=3035692 RepID=UPI00293930D9|nr:hypothetical protein [Endozoicomonas sp. 8E]WOG26992.1 hypothetical protein P6910_20940 [Endozoicomonas sp. 8E]
MKRRYIVELQQDAAFSNQSFSIKPDQRALSDNPSDIANKNGFKRPDLPSDDKQQRFFSYEVETTLIESISWQLLYATNLLVAFELITTSKAPPLGTTSYSWLPIEGIVTVGWLLKSYWNPDSPLFKPTEQTQVRLTQGNQLYAITTMMYGSGDDQQQSQLPESSGQQAPQTTRQPTSAFTSPLSSGSGDGYEDPQKHSHTLGLDCFVHPCHGVCKFRSYSDSANERSNDPFAIQLQDHDINDNPVNTTASAVPVHCNMKKVDDDGQLRNCRAVFKSIQSLLNHQKKVHSGKKTCLAHMVGKDCRLRPCGKFCKSAKTLSDHKRRTHSGQKNCVETVVGEDGLQRPCEKVCKNAMTPPDHIKFAHSGETTCDLTVLGEDGLQRPCGKICKDAIALSDHKKNAHTRQRTCDLTIVGEDGLQRLCGKLCKDAKALSNHKKKPTHTGLRSCDVTLVGKDGQQWPCGRVCKNDRILSFHKLRYHSGKKTCEVIVVGKNGKQQPCGKVCNNAYVLLDHKKRKHSGQRTCVVNVSDDFGRPWSCGKVCKNASALRDHKRGTHNKQQTCDIAVDGKDGRQRPCGTACKNAQTLSIHKKTHRKRKPVDVDQNDDLSPPKAKESK